MPIIDQTEGFSGLFTSKNTKPYQLKSFHQIDSGYFALAKQIDKAKNVEELNTILDGGPFRTANISNLVKITGEEEKITMMTQYGYGGGVYMLDEPVDQFAELSEIVGQSPEVLRDLAANTSEHYNRFFIWKDEAHTKKRWIEAPSDILKSIQESILRNIFYKIPPTKFAHGFVCGKSIVSNAQAHTGNNFVLKLDLKNFFPSITRQMLMGALAPFINQSNYRHILPAIELCLLDGRLPQGAPTSPAASNIVARALDLLMYGISRKFECTYTRYADDLIFSSNDDSIYTMIPIIKSAIQKFGLVVNEKKVKVLKKHQRQSVTGLVVNAEGQTSVSRRKRMKLRAFIHHIITGKRSLDSVNFAKLKGHITFINMANPNQGRWFLEKWDEIQAMRTIS